MPCFFIIVIYLILYFVLFVVIITQNIDQNKRRPIFFKKEILRKFFGQSLIRTTCPVVDDVL